MSAPSALSFLAATPSPGTGSAAATVIGFALIAAYLAGVVWLHRRRRHRRRAPRNPPTATAAPGVAHRSPAAPAPAEPLSVPAAGDVAPRIERPAPDRPSPAPPTRRLAPATLEPLG